MDNKEVIPELYNFLLPHLHQQNINEGMNIILKLNDCIKSLEHKTDLLTTRLEYLTKENELLRKINREHMEAITKMHREMQQLSNSNTTNMLQMTKYQLEEMKELAHSPSKRLRDDNQQHSHNTPQSSLKQRTPAPLPKTFSPA